ncbi:eukaryotic translation initiation factor 4E type 1B isoform X2 [Melanerpes formicivorus]|uniref:eukaryotic translation initiation factor 4E type 1B isoform X2 n=1 Tax=Melanerpes formicivorus TaxID=211600 RepID=UPI00358F653A
MATGEQRRQEERKRRRAQQRELLLAESLGKHPLQNRWALWFFKNDKSKMWQANLRLVTKFSTVEDFWAMASSLCGRTARTSVVGAGSLPWPSSSAILIWTVSGWKRCCASSGRCLMSTAMRCVGPSLTSELRGTRLPSGPGKQRTVKGSPTSGASTRSTWACRRRWPLGTRPTQTQPPKVAPLPRPSLWCDCGEREELPTGSHCPVL